MTLEHEIGESTARDGGGKWIDPVLGNYLVDNIPDNGPRLRTNPKIKLGIKPQFNHKVEKVT